VNEYEYLSAKMPPKAADPHQPNAAMLSKLFQRARVSLGTKSIRTDSAKGYLKRGLLTDQQPGFYFRNRQQGSLFNRAHVAFMKPVLRMYMGIM